MKSLDFLADNNSATAQTSASELANQTANGTLKNGKVDEKPKRKSIPPMWRVLAKARKTFEVQLSKDNKVKLECVEHFMFSEEKDAQKFWGDYFEQVAKLLDSRRYVAECVRLGYDAVNVAEHITYLGSTEINKVLKNGVFNTLGNDVRLYVGRLTPKTAQVDSLRKELYDFSGVKEKTTAETVNEPTNEVA